MQRKEKIPNWKYQQYTLKRTTVNNWKRKFSNPQKEKGEPLEKFSKKVRPSLVEEEFLGKIKEGIIRIRLTGAAISRKMVISIGNGVLKANGPSSLSEFGGGITLIDIGLEGFWNLWIGLNEKGPLEKLNPLPNS